MIGDWGGGRETQLSLAGIAGESDSSFFDGGGGVCGKGDETPRYIISSGMGKWSGCGRATILAGQEREKEE